MKLSNQSVPVFGINWDKSVALKEFLISDLPVKKLCKYYGGEDHWRKYYNDIWKWKKTDPDFREAYRLYMKRTSDKEQGSGGRPSAEDQNPDWRQIFCDSYIKYQGNREKAAGDTQYAFSTLIRKLDPGDSNYDEEFARMMRAAELKLAARGEALMVNAALVFEDDKIDLDTARIAELQSRVAEKVVQKLDHMRWGKRLEVSGKISHIHQLTSKASSLTKLMQEQREILLSKGQEFPMALPPAKEEPIDVEFSEIPTTKEKENVTG